jgi:hypothetical protein
MSAWPKRGTPAGDPFRGARRDLHGADARALFECVALDRPGLGFHGAQDGGFGLELEVDARRIAVADRHRPLDHAIAEQPRANGDSASRQGGDDVPSVGVGDRAALGADDRHRGAGAWLSVRGVHDASGDDALRVQEPWREHQRHPEPQARDP